MMAALRLRSDAFTLELIRRKKNENERIKSRIQKIKPPKQLYPFGLEREYQRDLRKVVGELRSITNKVLIPKLPRLSELANRHLPENLRKDDWGGDLGDFINQIEIEYAGIWTVDELGKVVRLRANQVSDFNRAQVARIFKRVLGLDLFIAEPWLKDRLSVFASRNVDLIRSIPAKALGEIKGVVFEGLISGVRWEEVASDISERFNVAESRADFIARDQISKLNGQLTGLRQTEVGVREYTWRTAGDERVRESHRVKEGKKFPWSDPPSDTGSPGDDYQCRCYAEPILEGLGLLD